MKKLLILFFFFSTNYAFSQGTSGIVRNYSNSKKISYASIFYKKADIGTYSDSTGNFKIQKIKGDTLVISSIGFEKFLIPADDIEGFLSVSLMPVPINLNEVEIKGGKQLRKTNGKKIYLGNLSGKKNMHISGMKGRTVAYLIKPDVSITGQIKSIQFGLKAEAAAIVKVHLYTVDVFTGKPDGDLLENHEFIKVKSGSKTLTVDLNHLNIELPSSGVFVALEWIGEINNNKSVNISPTYTNSNSVEPITVYIKFMDKNWVLVPKRKALIPYRQKGVRTGPEFYFDEPNFKITIVQ